MPIWLTTALALGGSALITLIVNTIWRRSAAKIARIKELEKKEKQDTKNQTPTEQKKSKSDSQLSEKDKQDLLNGLSNFGK